MNGVGIRGTQIPPVRVISFTRMQAYCALVVGFNTLLLIWLVFKIGGHQTVVTVDNLAQFVGPMLVIPICFPGFRHRNDERSRGDVRAGWAPTFLGGSIVCWCIGQIIWTVYELILKQATPFPSLADVAFMAQYPLLSAGVLLIPRRPLSGTARTRLAIDGLIILAALVTFSWFFILGPTVTHGGETLLARVLGTAYPAWDIVLVGCLLVLFARARNVVTGRAGLLLAAGLAAFIASDSYFDYANLQNTYATGALTDVGWPLACMLFGLAAYAVRAETATASIQSPSPIERDQEEDGPLWGSILPYAFVPAVGGLLFYVFHVVSPAPYLRSGVEAGAAVLVTLVVLRQILAIEENRHLSTRVRVKNRELAAANTRLEALATTDPHTDLPNHRAIVASLDRELERAFRYYRPCGILFIDLDHFKTLNDSCGHQAGDTALSELAGVMRETLRGVDLVGRWGGEEFVAILPETDTNTAAEVAERLRAAITVHGFGSPGSMPLTCSIGVASYPDDALDRDKLIELADRAMYTAKRLGRNQVRKASDALPAEQPTPGSSDRRADSPAPAVEALAALVDARDLYTGDHSNVVGRLSMQLALALGLSSAEADTIGFAGRLHDIGKIAVPDSVLRKPARLSDEEWRLIRRHPLVGADVMSRLPDLVALAPIVRSHHEWWNGQGYPDGLAYEEIPLGARIVGVVDAYSAMTTDRPYRERIAPEKALAELRRGSGTQFDPAVVRALEGLLALEWSSNEPIAG